MPCCTLPPGGSPASGLGDAVVSSPDPRSAAGFWGVWIWGVGVGFGGFWGGWLCPQLISILLVVALGETLVFWEERCFVILLIAATCFISKIVAGCRDINLPET